MRGKKAAQAATRRATDSQERVNALEAELATVRAEGKQEAQELKDQLRALRSALDQEVEKRAADRVEAVEARRVREVADMMDDYDRRADQLAHMFHERGFARHSDEAFARRALELFDKTLHTTQPDGSANRALRRDESHRHKRVLASLGHLEANPGATKVCGCGRCC